MIKHKVNRRLGQENWPSLSAVQKELVKIRERLMNENPQEKPWNPGILMHWIITLNTLLTISYPWCTL